MYGIGAEPINLHEQFRMPWAQVHVCSTGQGLPRLNIVGLTRWKMQISQNTSKRQAITGERGKKIQDKEGAQWEQLRSEYEVRDKIRGKEQEVR